MATDTSLQQVALGLDQAKQTVYKIMKKYYPKIEDSKSSLVNALVSGLAYLYSMFQVFAKLLQDELYVSTARELDSLYKLIPFVGIQLDEPTPMVITATTKPQDDSITDNTVPQLYISFNAPFLDSSSFSFQPKFKQYAKKNMFNFTVLSPSSFTRAFFINPSGAGTDRVLTLSLGKMLGDDFSPPSMSFANGDQFNIEFPYRTGSLTKIGRLKFVPSGNSTKLTGSDNGSDIPGDVSGTLWTTTGHIVLVTNSGSFNDSQLFALPVNVTYNVRSTYLKPASVSNQVAINYTESALDFFQSAILFLYKHNAEVPATSLVITNTAAVNTMVINAFNGLDSASNIWAQPIDPLTLVINHTIDTSIIFDFSTAQVIADPYWGIIYKVAFFYPTSGKTYYAYILDEFAGMIYVENPQETPVTAGMFTVSYTTKPSNKLFLEQFDIKVKSVSPPADFNFDNNTFTLEDTDAILFNSLKMQITDAGYTSLVFKQVPSLVTVKGDTATTYFEVRVLSPTKVEIKFDASIDYTTIVNLLITYDTVKNITLYKSGESLTGTVQLFKADGSQYTNPNTDFPFSASNVSSMAGASGIPTLEGLRDALTKAAFTLDTNINRTNYEAAIDEYYLAQGWDSRIKVFDYADFGNPSILLNSVNGNICYFVGLVNRFPNSDFVVVAPTELNGSPYLQGTAQNNRSYFDNLIAFPTTDFGLDFVNPVGKSSSDVDLLQRDIREASALTNIVFTEGAGPNPFSVLYAIYFKAKLQPANGFTFTQAKNDVVNYLASLFKWSTLQFVKDINVSRVYDDVQDLPSVGKILFSNLSHYGNQLPDLSYPDGINVAQDISYRTVFTTPSPTDILNNPLWDFSGVNTINRNIKIHILGLGGIDITQYPVINS